MLRVASGNKGFHLWWGSPFSRQLAPETRAVLLATLGRVGGPVPPAAGDAVMDVWRKRGVTARALFGSPSLATDPLACHFAAQVSPPFVWPTLADGLTPAARSVAHWRAFEEAHPQEARAAVMALGWPAIDAGVTLHRGHTLKCPFSLHAKTGKVAIPIPTMRDGLPSRLFTVVDLIRARAAWKEHPDAPVEGVWRAWITALTTFRTWAGDCGY
jgi:hypothetical protein